MRGVSSRHGVTVPAQRSSLVDRIGSEREFGPDGSPDGSACYGPSSNGKTPAFGAGNPGSNPGGPTQSGGVSMSGSTRTSTGPESGVTSSWSTNSGRCSLHHSNAVVLFHGGTGMQHRLP